MCILIGISLAVFRNCCLSLKNCLVKNAKIVFLKKKGFLSVDFIELKCRWLKTGLADLKKNTKRLCFFEG